MATRREASQSLLALLDLVSRRVGLAWSASHGEILEAGIRRAMARAGTKDTGSFRALVETDQSSLDALLAEVTVGETYFFRDQAQLECVRATAVADLLARRGAPDTLRLWSAGCASGEEAYSLAMLLADTIPAARRTILGTDVSRQRLAQARLAEYTRWSLRGLSADQVERFFWRRGTRFTVAAAARQGVEFQYLNLADERWELRGVPPARMDIVLCRNVLIYLDEATVAHAARRLLDSLSDDGWLFLGASDPMIAEFVRCETVVTDAGVAYRKRSTRRPAIGGRQDRVLAARSPAAIAAPMPTPLAAPPPAVAVRATPPDGAPVGEQPAVLLADARRCYAARDYLAAATAAAQWRALDGGAADGWIVLVRALANLGRLADAGAACASGLDRHRTSPELLYLHAVLLAHSGRDADAARAARQALYLDGGMIVAHLALGGALRRLGDRVGAGRAFRTARQLLAGLSADDQVAGADGEPPARLLAAAEAELRLLSDRSA